jgi:putative phage-type endonuclease
MTLHEYPELEQRSDEWHEIRRGIVTASTVGQLLTPTLKVADNETSRALTATLAIERINGWTEETRMTDDMWRGVEHEPIARDLYSEHHAPATEFGFMLRVEDGWTLGLSPDGVVGDDGLIEIKCPKAKTHFKTILTDRVPSYYMAQCQAALLASGRKWLDFVSFHGGMPLYTKRVHPDPDWFAAIEAACRQFERNVAELITNYLGRVDGLPTTERVLEEEIRF